MPAPTLIIANVQYKSPVRGQRGQGARALRSLLKYLQYRDNHDDHLSQDAKRERWVDCGMGNSHKTILQNCRNSQSEHVLAWTWVISPEPDVMSYIPEAKRTAFMQELTESVVERYYEERGFDPEYSYVIHHARTQDGRPHTHSHIILPGTVEEHLGSRRDMVNFESKGHLALLDKIANESLEYQLDVELGKNSRLRLQLGLMNENDIGR
jgi:hypothetical protein